VCLKWTRTGNILSVIRMIICISLSLFWSIFPYMNLEIFGYIWTLYQYHKFRCSWPRTQFYMHFDTGLKIWICIGLSRKKIELYKLILKRRIFISFIHSSILRWIWLHFMTLSYIFSRFYSLNSISDFQIFRPET
jgi:hypothetical protein